MIRTPFTELVGVEHPVVCAGMGGGHTSGELVGTVSEAGGLGVIGASWVPADELEKMVERAREITSKPIGINLLLHGTEERLDDVLRAQPAVLSTAYWPGAWGRVRRTRFIEEWLGREPELRRRREAVWAKLEATEESDPDYGLMWIGQSAGLIDSILPAGEVVREVVEDAVEILRTQLPRVLT